MSLVSQKTWDNMPDDEKKKIRDEYNSCYRTPNDKYILERTFGKGNLQQPSPKIKTWKDVAIYNPELWDFINNLGREISNCPYIDSKLYKKLVAAIHIKKLIELSYGGMVSEEEWKNEEWYKCVVLPSSQEEFLSLYEEDGFSFIDVRQYQDKQFIAFHTHDQREEFMSYPENVKLVKEYYYDEYRPTK